MKIPSRYLFFFIAVLFSEISFSQSRSSDTQKVQELKKTLAEQKSDSAISRIQIKICRAYEHSGQFDSAQYYAKNALVYATKTKMAGNEKWVAGIVQALNAVGDIYEYLSDYPKSLQFYFEALDLNKKSGTKLEVARSLNLIGNIYNDQGDYVHAEEYYLKSAAINKEIKNFRNLGANYNNLASIYNYKGEFNKSLELYFSALEINKAAGNLKLISDTYTGLGNCYQLMGNNAEALRYQLATLKISEQTKDSLSMSVDLNNVGIVYLYLENFEQAKLYLTRALEVNTRIKSKSDMADNLVNLGLVYKETGNLTKALECEKKALAICFEIGAKVTANYCYNNLGTINQELKNYNEALQNYFSSLKINEELNDKGGICNNYINIGATYLQQKNFKEAKSYLTRGNKLASEIRKLDRMEESYHWLTLYDSIKGDWKSALMNYKSRILYRDSLKNETATRKTVQLQMQYDFDKKSAADSIRNSEAKKFEEVKHQQEISKQKTFTYGGIIGFLVMIIVAAISYRAFRNKKKANVEIQHQKELVEEKQKEILDSIYYARRIQRALITNEKYFSKNLNRLNKF